MSLSSKRPASSPGGVKRSSAHKGSCRGLLIRGSHLQKFFDPVLDRKTHEVRSLKVSIADVYRKEGRFG